MNRTKSGVFNALLPILIADLASFISIKMEISEDSAIEQLYRSELYIYLENEKTKVWQFSTPKLFEMFESEIRGCALEFPDY
ncbi:MAG: hypothetical protein LBC28_05025 [Oscillospiraceae bacterium]|jgi:hypothetical protein|nr:hypothetical protein [Oscillospiraceae bacterium]